MDDLMAELDRRWREMFTALADGDDLPPGRRLRTEGMMEAAVLTRLATPRELVQAMDYCYRAAYGRGMAEDFGEDWQDFHPFPQIPAVTRRAPVYPSTSD